MSRERGRQADHHTTTRNSCDHQGREQEQEHMGETIKGKDGIVRGARVKTANGELKRPIQYLYPLELTCDVENFKKPDPTAPTFVPRATRDAAAAARLRMQDIVTNDEQ